jgi:hypothetical protein
MKPAEFNFPPCVMGDSFGIITNDNNVLGFQPYRFKMPFSLVDTEIRMWWATTRTGEEPVKKFSTEDGTLRIEDGDTLVIPVFTVDVPAYKYSYDIGIKTAGSEVFNITPLRGIVTITPEISK